MHRPVHQPVHQSVTSVAASFAGDFGAAPRSASLFVCITSVCRQRCLSNCCWSAICAASLALSELGHALALLREFRGDRLLVGGDGGTPGEQLLPGGVFRHIAFHDDLLGCLGDGGFDLSQVFDGLGHARMLRPHVFDHDKTIDQVRELLALRLEGGELRVGRQHLPRELLGRMCELVIELFKPGGCGCLIALK